MHSLTIAWEYLTGYSVAAVTKDGPSEWPPHPARVFMAMAAAWFETAPAIGGYDSEHSDHEAEGMSLRWLESLEEPELWLPPGRAEGERSLVTVYMPVNDRAGPASTTLQSVPALTRSKQARTTPCRYVGETPCALHWPEAQDVDEFREALARVCAKVTRIGEPSSLVRMWVGAPQEHAGLSRLELKPCKEVLPDARCRRISVGLLDSLRSQTQIPRIETFAELVWRIEDAHRALDEAKAGDRPEATKVANGDLKQAKEAFKHVFGEPFRKSASPPPRLWPRVGLWTPYCRSVVDKGKPDGLQSLFDTDLLILRHAGGPFLPVTSTLASCQALRDLIMKTSGVQPVPTWVSGHKADGSPNDDPGGHLAILPLPFVGREHADAHMLGMALAFPHATERRERGRVLGPLLVNSDGEPKDIALTLGALGVWTLRKRDWSEGRFTLQPETWTAHPTGSAAWASVTPMVLDKFPKTRRGDPAQRHAWEQEVHAIIAAACTRIRLPTPIHIDIDTTSWHIGSPCAITKRRQLRGRTVPIDRIDASFGDGFPAYPARGTKAPRPQVHVFLQFARPVLGPVLLGAGRYRGYGLFKPWEPAG